ncbi:MAG TPA: hypothetical protein P5533_00310 [Candidatus Cloacimonadota bacterium]|nr:hypothetical protein [Candidatus Cloacimonadota bacterium]
MKNIKLLKVLAFIVLMAVGLGFLASSATVPRADLVEAEQLNEISGIAASRIHKDILYAQNDSGGDSAVYILNTKGKLEGTLRLSEIRNRDWEDIAVGPGPEKNRSYIYLGEIGDNAARYESAFIYRIAEPDSIRGERFTSKVDKLEFVYADGARDAEALLVEPRTKDIVIISKREEQVGVYVLSYPQSTRELNTAKKVLSLPLSWVTAADISPRRDAILIKTYTSVYSYKVKKKDSLVKALTRKPKILPYIIEPQGEAICFSSDGGSRFTLSERSGDSPLYLYQYRK